MEQPIPELPTLHANPTTSHCTQRTNSLNSTNQLAHKSCPAPVASTFTNEHPNTSASHTQADKPFRCDQCPKKYKRLDSLHRHSSEKHSPIPITYRCTKCKKLLQSHYGYRQHWRDHHPNTPITYPCFPCNLPFKSFKSIQEHNLEIHAGAHQSDCAAMASNESTPVLEGQRHQPQMNPPWPNMMKIFKCTHCPKGYAWKQSLQAHIIKKHSNDSASFLNNHQDSIHDSINVSQESIPNVSGSLVHESIDVFQELPYEGIEIPYIEHSSEVVQKRKRRRKRKLWTRTKAHRYPRTRAEPVTDSADILGSALAEAEHIMHDTPQSNGQDFELDGRVFCEVCGKFMLKKNLVRHQRNAHRYNDLGENCVVQDHDDSVRINDEGINGQPEIGAHSMDVPLEMDVQQEIDYAHSVDVPHEMDVLDVESKRSSIPVIKLEDYDSDSPQSSNITPHEPVLGKRTRQIVCELKQTDHFIKHLLSTDSATDFTLETLMNEFNKLFSLITKLGSQGHDNLAKEWMQRKCSLWDEINYFKKISISNELECKRKGIMKLIEQNGNRQLVVEAIEKLKNAFKEVQNELQWNYILLDIRKLQNRFYPESIESDLSIINLSSIQIKNDQELLPGPLKTRLNQLANFSMNDIQSRIYDKLDALINLLLDVHVYLTSNQVLDQTREQQMELVQNVLGSKLPLIMRNTFLRDYLNQSNLLTLGQGFMPLRALCCFCVNWKAIRMRE